MVVGAISSRTDLAIIGAGPGGYVAALRAADAGLDVTLIERDQLGGTCLNIGCIPSKTLIEIANLRHAALGASQHGLDAQVSVDARRVQDRLSATSTNLRQGVTSLLRDAGVTVITGTANFARYDRLSIAHEDAVSHLEFDNAIIATGSRPVELPNFRLTDRIVDSTGALALDSVPDSMAIIGGGYIGVELGTAWAKLGTSVTIIEAEDSILGTIPAVLRSPVQRRLDELGVEVRTSARALHATDSGLELVSGAHIDAQIIVVAAGRRPNSDGCSLDTIGVLVDQDGFVAVDSQMRAARGVYAIGDLVRGPALAHKATAEAEVAVDTILGRATSFSPAAIPAVVFSDPEVMSVGVTPEEAEREGHRVDRFPHAASARAQTVGASTGSTVIVSDSDGTVLGMHAVGPHVSELAGEATLAIEMAATVEDLALTIHPHPTMSESMNEAAWLARGMPLHVRSRPGRSSSRST